MHMAFLSRGFKNLQWYSMTGNTGSFPAVKVSRKKRDSITWHAGRSDGAQPITRGRAGHDATGLREPDKSGQTTGA